MKSLIFKVILLLMFSLLNLYSVEYGGSQYDIPKITEKIKELEEIIKSLPEDAKKAKEEFTKLKNIGETIRETAKRYMGTLSMCESKPSKGLREKCDEMMKFHFNKLIKDNRKKADEAIKSAREKRDELEEELKSIDGYKQLLDTYKEMLNLLNKNVK